MGLGDIIESITLDMVLEFIGAGFVIGVLVYLVFGGGANELFEVWSKTVCG